ncbi:hypothetical protein [Aquabacterium sp. J223]|uniref:hypothetical protein n=1 Tax=Aquabacterium sp. J223 TaxID=2898431 RepID=UPI0021ADA9C1|nr:hypothetical protein [Aquabacterium sp. J223]UUX95588.1 hypothetical protein LRS07_20695 [Aquabacterium sp. J223]
MQAQDRPVSAGVFKPEGHVVVAFAKAEDQRSAADALTGAGFAEPARYTPEQMIAQADIDIGQASPLAAIGQELNLVKAHRRMAEQGASFLVVPAKRREDAQRVASIVKAHGASRAQHYGRLVIEDLLEVGDGLTQVGESPDRGLDAQNLSGNPHSPADGSANR